MTQTENTHMMRLSITLPAELYRELEALARDEGRSLSGQMVYLVRAALAGRGSASQSAPERAGAHPATS